MATSIGEIEATLRLKDELTGQLGKAGEAVSSFAGKTESSLGGLFSNFKMPSMETLIAGFTGFSAATDALELAGKALDVVGDAIGSVVDRASHLSDLNAQTAIGTKELQRFEFAGSLVGVSLEQIGSAASQLQRRIGGGGDSVVNAVGELGLSFSHLQGLGPAEQFQTIAGAIRNVEDPTKRANLAMETFGRSGLALMPLLRSDLEALGDEAERLGGVMDDNLVRAGDNFGDMMTRIQTIGKGLLADAVGPLIIQADKLFAILEKPGVAIETALALLDVKGLLPAWREFAGLVAAVFGSADPGGPPKAPKSFGKPNLEGADGRTFDPATRIDSKAALKEFEAAEKEKAKLATVAQKEIQRAAEESKKALDKLTGQDVIDNATKLLQQVAKIGGPEGISPDRIVATHKILDNALEVLAQRGQTASDAMVKLWAATLPTPAVIKGFEGVETMLGKIGTIVQKPIAPLADMFGQIAKIGGLDLGNVLGPDSFTGIKAGAGVKLPGFFDRVFGGIQGFGGGIGSTIIDALTGGGNIVQSVVGSVGNQIGGGLAQSLATTMKNSTGFLSTGLGNLLGGAAQAILPGIGALLGPLASKVGEFFGKLFDRNKGRDLVKGFAEQMGGFDALHAKLNELGAEGEQLWIRLTQGVGRNNPEQAKAAIDAVTEALERQANIMEHINGIVGGVNDRSKNVSSQSDLDVVSAGAQAAFALQVQQGMSALAAFQALAPAITAMKDAMAAGNLTLSEGGMRLMALNDIIAQNSIQFQNLAASGTIISAMLQGNIRDGALFAAVATDIGTQIQTIIDRGVPMEQALALAQPQLQALWEAQQKFGFATDATTQAILDQAVAQGFVGEQMKSVNQQILDVLLAIADVFGATIPSAMAGLPGAAEAAAAGMNEAFSRVRPPDVMAGGEAPEGHWVEDVPGMATGGIVRARAGGTIVRVGEGGQDEAIVPLGDSGGAATTLIVEMDGKQIARAVVPFVPGEVRRLGLA